MHVIRGGESLSTAIKKDLKRSRIIPKVEGMNPLEW